MRQLEADPGRGEYYPRVRVNGAYDMLWAASNVSSSCVLERKLN